MLALILLDIISDEEKTKRLVNKIQKFGDLMTDSMSALQGEDQCKKESPDKSQED